MGQEIFVFEGLPGSGKTSLTKYLDQKYEYCQRVGEVVDSKGEEIPQEEHYSKEWRFFVESELNKFRNNESEEVLLMDRGFPSTVSHGFCREVVENESPVKNIITELKEKLPDYVDINYVYLKNNPETSMRRAKHEPDDIWGKKGFLEATHLFYETFFLERKNVYEIDVVENSLEDVKREVESIIERKMT